MASNDNMDLQRALEVWRNADLPSLQQTLYESVLEIKKLESKTLETKEFLAQEIKQFKALDDDGKVAEFNKIIKRFQSEIDALTLRSQFSEQKLDEAYGKIRNAPDTKLLLSSTMDILNKQGSLDELAQENKELKDRLAKVADYDKLKERISELEDKSVKNLTKRILAKEQEVNSKWAEKDRNWEKKEAEMSKQLQLLKDTNKLMEAKLSRKADLANDSSPSDEEHDGGVSVQRSSAEFDLLAQELESAQLRILDLETRNEELSGNLAKATSIAEQESEMYAKDMKINELESENALLSATLDRERSSLYELNKRKEEHEKLTAQRLSSYENEIQTLRRTLAKYSDYEQLKQDLAALRKIGFGDTDGDAENGDDKSVDAALVTANKKLQSTLVEVRGKNQELQSMNSSLTTRVSQLQKQVFELEDLNAKLEADLGKIDDVSTRFSDTASMISGVTRQITNRTGRISPSSSIFGIPEDGEQLAVSSTTTTDSILPIVVQQRDRIRNKNMELERQVKQKSLDQGKLGLEIQRLKKDNQKLYERIRYLSSYSKVNSTSRPQSASSDVEAQYASSYEESLHPLANFKKLEQRRYHSRKMSPLEKVFLTLATKILANKTTRMLFLFYCFGLHALVMMMSLYVIRSSGSTVPA
ncbi:HDL396Cp [Eremothecium sinecaudum]|uniref:Protein CASP n=1 Tax=Eremothecium sinecaudum TaxID=45286 RepID=A0A0X8HS13_9SACH|nr:HDL396Cp [Eremothecium sinecaudum]AMD20348.1 HDL396Cp [Eremothecium sinecaudum]